MIRIQHMYAYIHQLALRRFEGGLPPPPHVVQRSRVREDGTKVEAGKVWRAFHTGG